MATLPRHLTLVEFGTEDDLGDLERVIALRLGSSSNGSQSQGRHSGLGGAERHRMTQSTNPSTAPVMRLSSSLGSGTAADADSRRRSSDIIGSSGPTPARSRMTTTFAVEDS